MKMLTKLEIKSLGVVFLSFLLINTSNGLYEDQIKKFDWRTLQIGKVQNAFLDLNSYDNRLIVSTDENVIASLCPKSGEIIWRQILEKSPRGDLKLFKIFNEQQSTTAAARRNSNSGFDIISVQGSAPAIVRGWSAISGNLEWEWSMMPLQPEKAENSVWFYDNSALYHVIPFWGSHLEVTEYFASSGQSRGTTAKISAPWIQQKNCLLSGTYFSCLEGNQLISIDLSAEKPQVARKTLPFTPKSLPKALKGRDGVLVVDNTLVALNENEKICSQLTGSSFIQSNYNQKAIILQAQVKNKILEISSLYADTCEKVTDLESQFAYPDHYGHPEIFSFNCRANKPDVKTCSFVVSTADGALLYLQQNKIRWVREESLTNVIATEFIDLPLSDSEGAIEEEFNSKPGDLLGAFVRRMLSQVSQLKHLFLHVMGLGLPPTATQQAGLVRDSFGLHKMLVVLTKSGKLFGIDNLSGKHHWMRYMPDIESFNNDEHMKLFIQRTARHFPKSPVCSIIAKDSATGNGVIFTFNPITGEPAEGGYKTLHYKIRQLSLLRETESSDFIKGILLLDERNQVHVLPEKTKEMAIGMYVYTADKKTATLDGYYVKSVQNNLQAQPIWNVRLAGRGEGHRIISVAAKNPIEHVHSQGRVLGDRSVLYKYINPNLIAVATEALDNIHKYIINVHLIDVVSGSIVFSMTHRKVRGPIKIVHSENWLAYAYYNDKVRRTEITTIELYEGKVQANSSVWSSLDAPPMPLVERQSYIVPTGVEALKETITERGITNKHVLIGTSGGSIVEMPWMLLDPRRPVTSPSQAREEGVIPYIPELPFPSENIINYNQTIGRIKNIYTSPSGLESTCLVVATGLDMYVTRVSPSKTFDLLKEDFDYFLITVVLIALISGSLFVKELSARKILRQAWK